MSALNICIDIDGTITDPYYWLGPANKYFNKNITEEQITEYNIHQVMGIDEHEYEVFYEENKFKLHSEEKIRDDAKPVLDLMSIIHNIYFVTARGKELEFLTHLYLRKNEIPFDGLYLLGSPCKVDKAKELKCNVFIEDSYDNAVQLSREGIMVLLMDTNYNRKPLYDNMIRVCSWKAILAILNELSFKKPNNINMVNF